MFKKIDWPVVYIGFVLLIAIAIFGQNMVEESRLKNYLKNRTLQSVEVDKGDGLILVCRRYRAIPAGVAWDRYALYLEKENLARGINVSDLKAGQQVWIPLLEY
jgi:hypothetical protein